MANTNEPPSKDDSELEKRSTSLLEKLNSWGSSAFPPMIMGTLVTAMHTRPIQPFPLLFAPALFFSGYVNVAGYAIDAAGISAAWSGLYVLLSLRRRGAGLRHAVRQAWTPAALRTSTRRTDTPARRALGIVTMGLGTVNCVAGGVTYGIMGDRAKEKEEREEIDRWGSA